MKIRLKHCILAALTLACGSAWSSDPIVARSDFDHSTEVHIATHGMDCGFRVDGLALGATWSSNWADGALLQVEAVNHFASMRAAALNVDGRIIELEMQGTTNHDFGGAGAVEIPLSDGQFRTDLDTIRAIARAKRSMLRLTTTKGYEECYIRKADKPKGSKAYAAIVRFLAAVDRVKPQAAQAPD